MLCILSIGVPILELSNNVVVGLQSDCKMILKHRSTIDITRAWRVLANNLKKTRKNCQLCQRDSMKEKMSYR